MKHGESPATVKRRGSVGCGSHELRYWYNFGGSLSVVTGWLREHRREIMTQTSTRPAIRIGLMTAVTFAVMLLAVWPHKRIYLYGENDFLAIYAGAKLAFSDQLYDPEAVRRVQVESSGATGGALRFSRLQGYAMILWPLGLMPYLWSYAVWQLANLAAVVGAVMLWPYQRALFASVLSVWLPLYISFAGGQDVSFIVLGLSAALWLFESGRCGWAGFALGICLIKFHFVWAIVLVLIRQRRYLPIAGLGAAACYFILPGFLVNADWPIDYFSAIVSGRDVISKVPYTLFPWLGWMGLAGVAVGVWFGAARLPLNIAASTALAAAVVVSPHGYVADYTLLTPMVALIWESRHTTARSRGNNAGETLAAH